MRTQKQLYHYLLSFADATLYEWYNSIIVDEFGDYREQTILVNCPQNMDFVRTIYDLEVLCGVMRNPNTQIVEDDNYLAICGGEKPYIITFNSFEEFMSKLSEEDREGLLKCAGEPDNLSDLERIAQEKEGRE